MNNLTNRITEAVKTLRFTLEQSSLEWDRMCSLAQAIDPNGDWTDVPCEPEEISNILNFFNKQLEELAYTVPSTEDVALVQDCYETFIGIDDIEPDAEYDAELTTIDVKATAPDNSYELQRYIVLTQNIAGCRTPSDTDGEIVNTVELSNAQLTLMQIAMDFGIAHVRQMYAELGDDISTENADYYCEELKKIAKSINDADTTDSTDIQIRN